MGPRRTANGDFFTRTPAEPVHGGVYRLLRDPMYDAYALGLVAAALITGRCSYLALAAESLVVLNLVEARVERLALASRPVGDARHGSPSPRSIRSMT